MYSKGLFVFKKENRLEKKDFFSELLQMTSSTKQTDSKFTGNGKRDWIQAAVRKGRLLTDLYGQIVLLGALLRDYRTGNYTQVPWKVIFSIGFAVFYLLMPIDVIPDFIPLLGLIDDTAVLGLVIAAFRSELSAYSQWRTSRDKSTGDHEVDSPDTRK